jgi:Arc/MetJ-type ribon-helix-helix transcriptional regulator
MAMQIVELDIKLSDEVKEIIRTAMVTGRYVYEDEVIAQALYMLLQDLASKGKAPPQSSALLRQPLAEMLMEFRQALDEKCGRAADVRGELLG